MSRTAEEEAAIDADVARSTEEMLAELAEWDRANPGRAALRTRLWRAMDDAARAYGEAVAESGHGFLRAGPKGRE